MLEEMLLSHWRSLGCGGHGPCHRPQSTHTDADKHTQRHTRTYGHVDKCLRAHARTHAHAHRISARRKQSATGEGPPGLFIAPIFRLPDVTSQQSEILFSCVIITARLTHPHSERKKKNQHSLSSLLFVISVLYRLQFYVVIVN